VNDTGGTEIRDTDEVSELRTELHLVHRELAWVRTEQEHQAEDLARVRRKRARLRDQVEELADALADTLSAAYWAQQRPTGLLRRGAADPEADLVREVESSPLFDGAWYLRRNPGAVRDRTSPALHYVRRRKHVDPGPEFSVEVYLTTHPEAAGAGLPLLVHATRHDQLDDAARGREGAEPVTADRDVHL
jgi:hypothetical protein